MYIQGLVATARDFENEPRIVELIGWNFRNICVLGGPSFEAIAPAVNFMLHELLRGCWKATGMWSICSRFAMESFCRLVNDFQARLHLLNNGLVQLLVRFVPTLQMASVNMSLNQSTLETLAVLLANDIVSSGGQLRVDLISSTEVPHSLFRFSRESDADDRANIRELAFICLACLATPVPGHPEFEHALLEFFGTIQNEAYLSVTLPHTAHEESISKYSPSVKECTGYIWVRLCALAAKDDVFFQRCVEQCYLLFDFIELAVENIKLRERGQAFLHDKYIPKLSQSLVMASLKCAVDLLQRGSILQRKYLSQENPIARVFIDCQALDKLKVSFEALGTIPSECFSDAEQLARALSEPGLLTAF